MQIAPVLAAALIGAAAALAGQLLADALARRRDRASYVRDAAAAYYSHVSALVAVIRTAYINERPDSHVDTARLDPLLVPMASAQVRLRWALESSSLPARLLKNCERGWEDLTGHWHERTLDENEVARGLTLLALEELLREVGETTRRRAALPMRVIAFARRNLPSRNDAA